MQLAWGESGWQDLGKDKQPLDRTLHFFIHEAG